MHADNAVVKARICALYEELYTHDGFGEMRIEMRILKRGQKEVIVHCGKQYRYVVDCGMDAGATKRADPRTGADRRRRVQPVARERRLVERRGARDVVA